MSVACARRENPILFRVPLFASAPFQNRIHLGDEWQDALCCLGFPLRDLQETSPTIEQHPLPAKRENFAWPHSCTENDRRHVSPRLRARSEICGDFFVRKHAVPLPFTFSKRHFRGFFQSPPLVRQIKGTPESPQSAIDARSRELRFLCCESLRVLIV